MIENTPTANVDPPAAETVLVVFHGFGPMIVHQNGEYHCAEGIARVIRQIIRALTDLGFKIVVTSHDEDAGRIYGFLRSTAGPDLRIMLVDPSSAKVMKAIGRLRRIASVRPFSADIRHLQEIYRARDFNSMPRALASTAVV